VIQTFISDWIGDLKSDVIINPPCKLSKWQTLNLQLKFSFDFIYSNKCCLTNLFQGVLMYKCKQIISIMCSSKP
jgi:hypothetical protein